MSEIEKSQKAVFATPFALGHGCEYASPWRGFLVGLTQDTQAPYPQVVLFGDSLWQGSVDTQDGFSFYAALQKRECPPALAVSAASSRVLRRAPLSGC